jgi:hypothetical protein
MVVEFLGLPGVGKTAVSKRTAEYLAQWGLTVFEPVRALSDRSGVGSSLRGYRGKSLLVARELLAHPAHSFRSIRAIGATAQPSLPVLLMIVANWLMQCSLLRSCRRTRGVHLFDEGIFQGLWSIGLEGRPGAVHGVGAALHSALEMPDVVAVVEADLGTVSQRLQGRNGHESRADRQWSEDGRAIADASMLMGKVIEALMRVSGGGEMPRVIHVDNGTHGDPDAAAWNLACQIERYWLTEQGEARAPTPGSRRGTDENLRFGDRGVARPR